MLLNKKGDNKKGGGGGGVGGKKHQRRGSKKQAGNSLGTSSASDGFISIEIHGLVLGKVGLLTDYNTLFVNLSSNIHPPHVYTLIVASDRPFSFVPFLVSD